ncbi:hypothetical protein U3516DRAFT_745080 [Neocallimastix sp. 'constans']
MEKLKIDISETNRGKEINQRYIDVSNIKLKTNKEMLQYDGVHNYFEQKINDSLSLIKYKIKKEIKKSSIPFNIKPKRVFNQISQDIGFIYINKQHPPNISSFEEIPENTFYVAPDFSYHVFITRNFQETYKTIFKVIKSILLYYKRQVISNAAIILFPDINIRYCIWLYKRSLRHHKYKIFYNEKSIFNYYDIENWNYYNNIEHITNNTSESFNNYLGGIFSKKPTYFILIYKLNNDVSLYPDTYERRILGVWNKQKRKLLSKSIKLKNIIESYKKMESFLIGNEKNRSHIAGLWFECLINLNDKIN